MPRLPLHIAVIAAAILLTISCENDEYAEGLHAYRAGSYDLAFRKFSLCAALAPESPIADYYLYYAGRCAIKTRRYAEAIPLMASILNAHPRSLLREKARQYHALADFLARGSPTNELLRIGEAWIARFVGNAAAEEARAATNSATARSLYLTLIETYADSDASAAFHDRFAKDEKPSYPTNFTLRLMRGLLEGGNFSAAARYAAALTNASSCSEEALYSLALAADKTGRDEQAEQLYERYLTVYTPRREQTMRNLIEVYRGLGKHDDAVSMISGYLSQYPASTSASYLYRRLVLSHLSKKRIDRARDALRTGLARFPKNEHMNMSARNFLRTMYEAGNTNETYWALSELKKIHAGGDRYDYYLSWARWVYRKFGMTNEMKAAVSATLHTSKNPFLIVEALPDADDAMIASVSRSNEAAFADARRYRSATNTRKMLDALNRVQFIESARTDMPSPDFIRARDMASAVINEHPFVRALTAPMDDPQIVSNTIHLSPDHAEKAFLLSAYGDHENAENEITAVRKAYPASPTVIRALALICSNANNYGILFKYTASIGDHFNYPFKSNPYLLPTVLRRYLYPEYYREFVEPSAQENGIENAFLYALIRGESAFDADCVSWANAYGLMQLLYSTASSANRDRGRRRIESVELTNPEHNILLGTVHLRSLLATYNGDYFYTLAAYNAGGGNVKRWRSLTGRTNPYLFTRLIDYPETEYYVEKIMRNCHHYRLIAAEEELSQQQKH